MATVDQISLVLRDERIVLWGSADESDLKAEVLGPLLSRPGQTYDVSVPGQATVPSLSGHRSIDLATRGVSAGLGGADVLPSSPRTRLT